MVNPYDTMLAQAREQYASAARDRAQADATLQAFLAQRETPTSVGRSIMEMRLQDTGLQALRSEVVKRSEELGRVATGLEDKHPAKKPALDEYLAINKRLQTKEAEFETVAYGNLKSRLLASQQQTQKVEVEIRDGLKKIEGQAADYARNFQKAMRITDDIRKREQEHKEVRDRLNYLQNESAAIGFVRLVAIALPAETPQGVGKTKLLLLVFLLAGALALVAPIALDLSDNRIHTVNDAEKLMGISAAGWQVMNTDLPSEMFAKEQTRRFASTLIRNRDRTAKNVFSFASIKTAGGVDKLILNTAAALQQLGFRVLVVDANSFTPSTLFKPDQPGLSNFLAGQANLDAVQHTLVYQGECLGAVGFGDQKFTGVQRLDLLQQAVAQWRQHHDYVLVALPPVLLSADAELLIGALGQVFMVLEAQSVSRGEVVRAKRLLEKLDPEAVGLFVNSIPMFEGGGYMQELLLETLTKHDFTRFMSLSNLRLQVALLHARWVQNRMGKTRA